MNAEERSYRRIINSIGFGLLIFLFLINFTGILLSLVISPMLELLLPSDPGYTVAYELIYGACYLASFIGPACFIRLFIHGFGEPTEPIASSPRLSPWLLLFVPAGVAVVFAVGNFNFGLTQIIDYSIVMPGENDGTVRPAVYELVLEVIVYAVVPGVCEEFLFRGVILSNLRRFGRQNAILISALLFGLMHENIGQILYAFAAGIVLGQVYEKTGNIWNCTILHTVNNSLSVVETVLVLRFPSLEFSGIVSVAFEAALLLVGLFAAVLLVRRFFAKGNDFHDGVFGKSVPASDAYAESVLSPGRSLRLFLSPPMLIFLILCALSMLLLIAIPYLLEMAEVGMGGTNGVF